MGRRKEDYAVYPQIRRWKTKDGKKHSATEWRIRYWSGEFKNTMPTGKKSRKDAYAFALELKAQGKFNFAPSFRDYATGFFDRDANIRAYAESTLYQRKINLSNVLLPLLGDHSLSELTRDFLENCFQGLIDSNEVGKSTITSNYYTVLSPIFRKAVTDKLLTSNPLEGISLYEEDQEARQAFTLTEVRAFFTESPWADRFSFFIALLSATSGLRIGEIIALQTKHIRRISVNDERVYLIAVEQSYSTITKKIGPPKTKSSIRFVPVVSSMVLSFIIERVVKIPATETSSVILQEPDYFIFSEDGSAERLMQQTKVLYHLNLEYKERFKKTKPRTKTFHSFRHFFNSRMLILTDHNESLVKALMGHGGRSNMTVRYMTASEDKFLGCVEPMSKILGTLKDVKDEEGNTIGEVPGEVEISDAGRLTPENLL